MTIDVAITAADGQQYGHVTSMALNADGTRLYATVPVSEMYGPNGWVWQGNTTPGEVIVINVDERDRPAPGAEENSQNWRGVIKRQTVGVDPFQVIAVPNNRSEEHTSALQSLMRLSYAVFRLKKKTDSNITHI